MCHNIWVIKENRTYEYIHLLDEQLDQIQHMIPLFWSILYHSKYPGPDQNKYTIETNYQYFHLLLTASLDCLFITSIFVYL